MTKSELKTAAKAIRLAVEKAGSQSNLARQLDDRRPFIGLDAKITQSHVHYWLKKRLRQLKMLNGFLRR